MGWLVIVDRETGEEAGICGDRAWDEAGVTLSLLKERLNSIYQEEFGRDMTDIEFTHTIEFVMPVEK